MGYKELNPSAHLQSTASPQIWPPAYVKAIEIVSIFSAPQWRQKRLIDASWTYQSSSGPQLVRYDVFVYCLVSKSTWQVGKGSSYWIRRGSKEGAGRDCRGEAKDDEELMMLTGLDTRIPWVAYEHEGAKRLSQRVRGAQLLSLNFHFAKALR